MKRGVKRKLKRGSATVEMAIVTPILLTLVFGIMDLVNLAHGSLSMVGAFFAATFAQWTGSFVLGVLLALPAALAAGIVITRIGAGLGSATLADSASATNLDGLSTSPGSARSANSINCVRRRIPRASQLGAISRVQSAIVCA